MSMNSTLKTLVLCFAFLGAQSTMADVLVPIGSQDSAATVRTKMEARNVGARTFVDPSYRPGLLRHLVLFRYKAGVTFQQKAEVRARFLALQHRAVRNGYRYLISIETGAQNSGEGVDQGLEQGFVVTFRSQGDRNYYVGGPIIDTSTPGMRVENKDYFDPEHQAFKDFAGPLLDGVVVFDFSLEARAAH